MPPPAAASATIAVTGATGFIGAALCRRLCAEGYTVRALVRRPRRAAGLAALGVELIDGDLHNSASLDALLVGAAAVVHCAGNVRGVSQACFDAVNVEGLRHLLQACKAAAVPPRLLSLSSLAAREPDLSYYAASKFKGEQLLLAEAGGLEWTILRPPPVYGPGDKELLPLFRLMARGLALIPGPPAARFSMLYVDDLVAAVVAWLRCPQPPRGIYTVDDGRRGGYDWPRVASIVGELARRRVRLLQVPAGILDGVAGINRAMAKLLGYAPMLTPQKLRELRHPDWVCDSDALQQSLGEWRPRITLEQGLQLTLK